jgi:hypothetical protein
MPTNENLMPVTYSTLQQACARFAYGTRDLQLLTQSQLDDIADAIRDGYLGVLLPPPEAPGKPVHQWSFMRPLQELTLTAPYATGTITATAGVVTISGGTWPTWAEHGGELFVRGRGYWVTARDGLTITVDDETLALTTATTYQLTRCRYELPENFGGIEGPLTYAAGAGWPRRWIEVVKHADLRRKLQVVGWISRPSIAAIVPKTFDPGTGTLYQIEFWPRPDADYVLTYVMRAIAVELSDDNEYPMGGPDLGPVITESCLAAMERLLDDAEGIHGQQAKQGLLTAISLDRQNNSPDFLGYNSDHSDCPAGNYPYGRCCGESNVIHTVEGMY